MSANKLGHFERFPDKVAADGCQKLIDMYGAKYPALRKQWEDRIAAYQFGQDVNIWM